MYSPLPPSPSSLPPPSLPPSPSLPLSPLSHIPLLWFSKMKVINTIQVHVLRVPSERCLPHPKVQVSCINAWNAHPILLCYSVQYGSKVIDVPFIDA